MLMAVRLTNKWGLEISNCYKVGDCDRRPWGEWKVSEIGDDFVVKRITVNPGCRLSLQYHEYRSEIWIVVEGDGIATLGDDEIKLSVGEIAEVGVKMRHRMHNCGSVPLVFIEIQRGQQLAEADVIRIEDDFGRL